MISVIRVNSAMSTRRSPSSARHSFLGAPVALLLVTADAGAQQVLAPPSGALVTRDPSGWLQTSTPDGTSTCAIRSSKASAATLCDVVDFQDTGFHIDLSEQQKQDLVAFLAAL